MMSMPKVKKDEEEDGKENQCLATLPTISNYKISFPTGIPLSAKLRNIGKFRKIHHNFAVIKRSNYVFSVNFSGYINITKLRNRSQFDDAIKVVCKHLHLQSSLYTPRIDNITASGTFGRTIPLHVVGRYFAEGTTFPAKFKYNPNYFSGASIKFHDGGTIILFSTGSYTLVGCKTEDRIQIVYRNTHLLLQGLLWGA
jgi:Transcription factor TFIID (or TATA-binding protein, TBP)